MVLYGLLVDPFIHYRRWNAAVDASLRRCICLDRRQASLLLLRFIIQLEGVWGELPSLPEPLV